MFYSDGTFNFHKEIMALAEEFCEGWVQRNEPFKNKLEAALVLNFALCTIQHDLEDLLHELEWQPVFEGVSPRKVYELGGYGDESPKGLSNKDIAALLMQAMRRLRRN